ncbi:hypothetical protein GOODEAATRI_015247, partial [Goodea atripinnis]
LTGWARSCSKLFPLSLLAPSRGRARSVFGRPSLYVAFISLLTQALSKTTLFVFYGFTYLGLFLRGVSVKSRCPTPTPPALQGAGTAGWTHQVRRAACRLSESGGRTPEVMATPLRTGLMGISRLICQRDMVSYGKNIITCLNQVWNIKKVYE